MIETIFIVGLLVSYYVWWKQKTKINLYFVWFCAIVLLELGWQYLAKNVLHLSESVTSANLYFEQSFSILAIIVAILLVVRSSRK
jgi:hypothetical protein